MHFVYSILTFLWLTFLCDGCLRTPTVGTGPTIPAGPTNPCSGSFISGASVFITAETVDASGVFSISVDCTNMAFFLTANGGEILSRPETFVCDAAIGKYTITVPGPTGTITIDSLAC
uniref:Uncharacterized protein n=1 Tax=Panagrolaimus sp. PS1159 TaxID=55785 RepID=A0AC35F5H1_9BILA